jgi:hypothetical protein
MHACVYACEYSYMYTCSMHTAKNSKFADLESR